MKARSLNGNNRTRPPWWSALLSLVLTLLLVAPPSHLCALMESAPGHAHSSGHSHADSGHAHSSGHSHAAEHAHSPQTASHHHDGDPHDATRPTSDAPGLSAPPQAHHCCSDMEMQPVVAVASPRLTGPDSGLAGLSFAPAVLPVAQNIFVPTNCRGRDGPPPDEPLRPQSFPSSLLGRAPPASV